MTDRPAIIQGDRTVLLEVDHVKDNLFQRLSKLAETGASCAIDASYARFPFRVEKVRRQGSATMVLGVDLETDEPVGLHLDDIHAIAILEIKVVGQWRPAPGEPAPAGHLPCPCRSGERYRDCCRRAAADHQLPRS